MHHSESTRDAERANGGLLHAPSLYCGMRYTSLPKALETCLETICVLRYTLAVAWMDNVYGGGKE